MHILKIILFFLLLPDSIIATNYFVATTGSDLNNGSILSPFATIQFALNTSQPGDTIYVRGGTYFEKISWTVSGSINNTITLKNYNNETAIIDGTGTGGGVLLTIHDMSYIEISGIIFQNNYLQDAQGIYVYGEGSHITIKNCEVKNIGWTNDPNADPFSVNPAGQAHAILFNGRTANGIDSIKISDCTVHDIISGNSEAVTLAGNVDGFEINRDTVYNTKNIGIVAAGHYSWAVDGGVDASLNQARNGQITHCVVYDNRRFSNTYAPAGIYVDGGGNIKLIANKCYSNGNGISIGCENPGFTANNITVMNNVVYNNDNHGMVFGSNAALVKTSTVINNSFFRNGSFQPFTLEINLQNSDSCIIANNIAVPRTNSHYGIGIFGYTASHLTVDNNLLYRYSGSADYLYVPGTPAQFTPINGMSVNPEFSDTALAHPDLYISNTSPAINTGTHVYPLQAETDAALQYRIVNGTIDIGAYERQDGGCPGIFTIDDAKILKGKFVASQTINFNRSAASVINDQLLWSSPSVNVLSAMELNATLYVNTAGCN